MQSTADEPNNNNDPDFISSDRYLLMEELAEEVQARFPDEHVTQTLLMTIYDAAKRDHPKRLIAALSDIPNQEYIKYLVNVTFHECDGQTVNALVLAAMSGSVGVTHALLEKFHARLEDECNIIFDGLVVYGATALWVAAGMGQMEVVKVLVRRGANVNHNTAAHSSPLRAACYEGRLDIVKYLIKHGADVNLSNIYNNTCIMIAAYKGHVDVVDTLLKHGANPNDQALCGATALHYAAECGHVDVCRLLLDHGARLLKNELGLTAVMQAAERTHESVVQMFVDRDGLMTNYETLVAFELLGASFANDKDNYNIAKAYQYMMRSMEMRYADPDNVIPKQVLPPVKAYDFWLETEHLEDLRAIRFNHHSIHMEALTVRERILGKNFPDLSHHVTYRGAVLADQGRFQLCQRLWDYGIELRMICNLSISHDLLRFAQLFSQILRMPDQVPDLSIVLSVLTKCQQEIENNKQKLANPGPKDFPALLQDYNQQNVVTALYFIKIITKMLARPNVVIDKTQIDDLYATLLKFIKCDTRMADGQTLLHLAVNGVSVAEDFYTTDICKFPCYPTALLLVNVGASVLSVDQDRNTPLHTLLQSLPRQRPNVACQAQKIAELFLSAGAHLDAVNYDNLTPAQVVTDPTLANFVLNLQNTHISLRCMAARAIAYHRIDYRGQVPVSLENFIQMHSAYKICD